jgi:hypothetical protein
MSEAKNRELTLLVTAGILAAFAVVDFWTPFAFNGRNDWLQALAFGGCIAQVTLIAAWAVFAPGNIVVRLPWSLLLGLMMWYVLSFAQQRAARMRFDPRGILVLGIILLVGMTVLQVPLWTAKRALRYRMLKPGEVAAPIGREPIQFQLKHLLLGTFLLSIALSPIRLVLPRERVESLMRYRELWEFSVITTAVIIVNLVATLPCLWGGLASKRRVVPLGLAWAFYGMIITGIEVAVLCAMLPHSPELLKIFFLVYLMNVTQGVVVFAVMRIYRTLGYSLQRMPRASA